MVCLENLSVRGSKVSSGMCFVTFMIKINFSIDSAKLRLTLERFYKKISNMDTTTGKTAISVTTLVISAPNPVALPRRWKRTSIKPVTCRRSPLYEYEPQPNQYGSRINF
jgi:hypothetical protein